MSTAPRDHSPYAVNMRQQPDALAVDLDGVVRVLDPVAERDVEMVFSLPSGVLTEVVLRWELLQLAVTGQISHEAWQEAASADLAKRVALTPDRAREAVDAWRRSRGT